MTTYTEDELEAEARRLIGEFGEGFPTIRGIGPNAERTGLEVQLQPGTLAEAQERQVDLDGLLSAASSYPIEVNGESDPRRYASR